MLFTAISISIEYLLCFLLAGICDWWNCSRCSCRTGWAGDDGGGGGGGTRSRWRRRSWRRKRVWIINEGLSPFSLLNHLNQAVGHKHDDDGGYREAW